MFENDKNNKIYLNWVPLLMRNLISKYPVSMGESTSFDIFSCKSDVISFI